MWTWACSRCWSDAHIFREVPTWFAAQRPTRRKKRMPPHLSPASSAKAGCPRSSFVIRACWHQGPQYNSEQKYVTCKNCSFYFLSDTCLFLFSARKAFATHYSSLVSVSYRRQTHAFFSHKYNTILTETCTREFELSVEKAFLEHTSSLLYFPRLNYKA